MRPIRVADSGLKPARWNVAMTAALAELHRAGRIPDTLRFYRYPRSLLIGRDWVLGQEARVDRIRRKRIELARRITGGAPIWVNPGILAFDLVADRRLADMHLGKAADRVRAGVADGLRRLGLPARPGPLTDIHVNGQKIFEARYSLDGPTFLFQGMVVVDVLAEESAEPTLSANYGSMVSPRVASIAEFVGRTSLTGEVTDVLVAGFAHALRCTSVAAALGDEEVTLSDRLLAEKIGTDDFVLGESAALATAWSKKKRPFSQ